MGGFSKRGKDAAETDGRQRASTPTVSWATNAPAHWPALRTEPLPFPDPKTGAEEGQNNIAFAANLERAFEAARSSCRLAAIAQTRLQPDGVLKVPIEVQDAGSRHSVFAYASANEASAGRFAAVATILRSRGEPEPIYFAPSPLPPAQPGRVLRMLEPHHLERLGKPQPGCYAMWWLAGGPVFDDSPTACYVRAWYESLEGIYSYAMALFARSLELVDRNAPASRVALPDDDFSVPAKGPENRPLIVLLSGEKGIQFLFHTDACGPGYRDAFWRLSARFAEWLRGEVTRRKLPLDPPDPEHDRLGWLRLAERSVTLCRELGGGEIKCIGAAIIEE